MVSSGITQDGLSKRYIGPCLVSSLRVKTNSVLCAQCGNWIHSGCAGVKRVNPMFSWNFTCRECEQNIGEAVEQEDKLCDEVEIVTEFTYFGDMVSASGGCMAAVTARTRCGWVKFSVVSCCMAGDFL